MRHTILILEHDRALAGLIARTLRSQQIYCEPVPFTITQAQVKKREARGLIFAAAPGAAIPLAGFDTGLLAMGVPVLALGGMAGALCRHDGGEATPCPCEGQNMPLTLAEHPLLAGMDGGERVLHDLYALQPPQGTRCLAQAGDKCIGYVRESAPVFAMQYPIERNDPDAIRLLFNFADAVCGMPQDWTEENIISLAVERIAEAAAGGRVLCAVSGGVDSAVAAVLARQAVGERLTCVFIDTGLFRRDEPQAVLTAYRETLGLETLHVDAGKAFLSALEGLRTAQEKEHTVTLLLAQALYKQASELPGTRALVLGTNYNDRLYGENHDTGEAIGESPDGMRVCEPLRDLFKDEVRRLARALQLPTPISERQPYPASGLALRVLGLVTGPRLALLRQADAFFIDEVRAAGHERRLWQHYATLCENPDEREGYAVILRACQACSGEACASRLPYDLLERVAARILHELPEVTRVLYDLTPSAQYALVE